MRTVYGPPEVVRITDVPAPEVGPGDVRVAVHATTVNRTDCGIRVAKPFFIRAFTGIVRPRTRVLGNEFAGVVESVGPGVTRFCVGDRVFGYTIDRRSASCPAATRRASRNNTRQPLRRRNLDA